jgi:hypothetical protein
MKKTLLLICSMATFISHTQKDWELPLDSKGNVQFEFTSKKLTTKKDVCETYISQKSQQDLNQQLTNKMLTGKSTFTSGTNFTIFAQLVGSDGGNWVDAAKKTIVVCNPNTPDTLFGSLKINISQTSVVRSGRSGAIDCVYRIILHKDHYEIKLRGFKITLQEFSAMKGASQKTLNLGEYYQENKSKKADQSFWSEMKWVISMFNSTLEEVMATQESDFNFDD